jgi:hypothetical protein
MSHRDVAHTDVAHTDVAYTIRQGYLVCALSCVYVTEVA